MQAAIKFMCREGRKPAVFSHVTAAAQSVTAASYNTHSLCMSCSQGQVPRSPAQLAS